MLKCHDLSVSIRGKTLLQSVNLELQPGEFLALVGPNGAGKSTLLKALAGSLALSSGSIEFHGKPLKQWNELELARQRAVMNQDNTLGFPFTALEVVLMGRYPHSQHWESARDMLVARQALREVEAEHLAGRNFLTLSGGERQRVQFARAIAQLDGLEGELSGRALFLDEPTSNLDLRHQHVGLQLARTASRKGCAVLAVLHDLNLALQYATRILIMDEGRMRGECPKDPREAEKLLAATYGVDVEIVERAGKAWQVSSEFTPIHSRL